MDQKQKQTPAPRKREEGAKVKPKDLTDQAEKVQEKAEEIEKEIDEALAENKSEKSDIDELVDEIDELLEPNAAQFVLEFVQRGGQ